ncbi:MAG: hypothetical protein IH961_05735 [Chloroflexi bacterium]|nr:hypothetical protein [Chloroflexota bacterium]
MAQEPMNTDSAAGRPPSRGMKIGFLLAGSPEKARVYAVLAALPLLDGVSTVRLAWSDASQAEFSALSSFSASPGELIDRLTDELLHLPGFRVEIQGVTRVPYPVLVFRAEPGAMDRDAVGRRSRARSSLAEQEQAQRGAAQIERQETGVKPGRTPGAGNIDDHEDAPQGDPAARETPMETAWAPGSIASTVREPGFENVIPRLHPAPRPRKDPIEPVVRSHYPRPSPVNADGDTDPGMLAVDWLIEVSEETGLPASAESDESVPHPPQADETIGTIVLGPDELPEGEDAPWQVLVSEFYPDIGDPDQLGGQMDAAGPTAGRDPGAVEQEEVAWQKLMVGAKSVATRNRPRRESLWSRVMNALFGETGPDRPDTPGAPDTPDMPDTPDADGADESDDAPASASILRRRTHDDSLRPANPDLDEEREKAEDDDSPM